MGYLMQETRCAVIFGGTGFVGVFMAQYLLDRGYVNKVFLYDLERVEDKPSKFRQKLILNDPRISVILGDVRQKIHINCADNVSIIFNFAAIHREPGHQDSEYFETNLLGAKNVCDYAEAVNCQTIVFTSSISPYGVSESVKDESTLPLPTTAYGSSKLIAEKIHEIWYAKDIINRRLLITRPGVVFGPGEGGNVSRLIRAVIHGYFFYMGNKSTRKAGIYVKELCHAIGWMLQEQSRIGQASVLFNISMNPGPSISEYVNAICAAQGIRRFVPSVPYILLITFAHLVDALSKPFAIKHPFSPVRVRKLVRSNNILPTFLICRGYKFQYSLDSAFADWKKCCPEEWK